MSGTRARYRRRPPPHKLNRRFLVGFMLVAMVGVFIYLAFAGGVLAVDGHEGEYEERADWLDVEEAEFPRFYGPIDTALLQTNFDHVAMVYKFYYEEIVLDFNRHRIIDNESLVRLITYSPGDNKITISTDVPVVFTVEYGPDTEIVYIIVKNPRSIYDKIVVIDPGHGGIDTGASVGAVRESDIVLAISLMLYDLFLQSDSGIKAFLTRNDDSFVFNAVRANIANTVGDLLLSVHTNTYEGGSGASGTEVLFRSDSLMEIFGNSGRANISNAEFSQITQDHLVEELGTRDRGIIERTNVLLINAATVPTAYAEIDFKTNPAALENLTNTDFQRRVALALYRSVVEAFKRATVN